MQSMKVSEPELIIIDLYLELRLLYEKHHNYIQIILIINKVIIIKER